MALQSDQWICQMAIEHKMFEPFADRQVREFDGKKRIGFILPSCEYDLRVSSDFKVFTDVFGSVIDPKQFCPHAFVDIQADRKIYCARLGFEDLDSLSRQSQIEASIARSLQQEHHSQIGKGDDEDRFGKVAASPNLKNLTARSIDAADRNCLSLFIEADQ